MPFLGRAAFGLSKLTPPARQKARSHPIPPRHHTNTRRQGIPTLRNDGQLLLDRPLPARCRRRGPSPSRRKDSVNGGENTRVPGGIFGQPLLSAVDCGGPAQPRKAWPSAPACGGKALTRLGWPAALATMSSKAGYGCSVKDKFRARILRAAKKQRILTAIDRQENPHRSAVFRRPQTYQTPT